MKTSPISNKEIKLGMKNTDNNSIKYSLEVTKILVIVCVFIFLNMFRKNYTLL